MLTRILIETARISSWKTSCCLGVRSETCSGLHWILPLGQIRANTKLKQLKNSKVTRGGKKSKKESRKYAKRAKNSTALFPMYISLRKYFQDFCPTNQIKITEQSKKHKLVPRRFPMLQRYLFNKYHVWIKWDHQPSHKMVLQIFNEALQCVIYRVMVGARWLQEAAAPSARTPRDLQGVRFLLQEGKGRDHWNVWKSGTCKIKNCRVISKTQEFWPMKWGICFLSDEGVKWHKAFFRMISQAFITFLNYLWI